MVQIHRAKGHSSWADSADVLQLEPYGSDLAREQDLTWRLSWVDASTAQPKTSLLLVVVALGIGGAAMEPPE